MLSVPEFHQNRRFGIHIQRYNNFPFRVRRDILLDFAAIQNCAVRLFADQFQLLQIRVVIPVFDKKNQFFSKTALCFVQTDRRKCFFRQIGFWFFPSILIQDRSPCPVSGAFSPGMALMTLRYILRQAENIIHCAPQCTAKRSVRLHNFLPTGTDTVSPDDPAAVFLTKLI